MKTSVFWGYVEKTDTCWIWKGCLLKGRRSLYGSYNKKLAHRVAYELLVGSIPHGLVLDHLCRNSLCVRPDHLEPVTNKENILRGTSPWAVHARTTHCPAGHEYSPSNTRIRKTNGSRHCIECRRVIQRNYDLRRRGKKTMLAVLQSEEK